ncbi:uncharacterized protein LOC110990219 [Acanthaster planci]|uniref:Uncharacterized protein LOC110990219 n=1 Tax=Acanthaster planci TaxID=133434 RepID=A0A8B8A4E1_ACAPL|nr:uncharacterized protein LOC110990219 [Acanthaster planci]
MYDTAANKLHYESPGSARSNPLLMIDGERFTQIVVDDNVINDTDVMFSSIGFVTTAFAEFLRGQHIDSHEALISFNVVSLFTNVPIDGACCVARRRLEEDPELPDRTTLSPTEIVSLLEFVLRSTYFLYDGAYYEQTDGAAMGSPVSAVIANLYMESFEEEALQSCPPDCRPTLWKRYVHGTFVIAPRDQTSHLLNHLNSLKPSIQFTIENEQDNSIAFLDTMVHREPDSGLTSTIYRKPTHTDQYLAFDSHHPMSVKRAWPSAYMTAPHAESPDHTTQPPRDAE